MSDIRDRLKKLARLVRHDEEALSTCEDAVKELDRLMPVGDAGAVANAAAAGAKAHSWYRGTTFAGPMPPSQTTQVKLDGFGQIKTDLDLLRRLYQSVVPTRGV